MPKVSLPPAAAALLAERRSRIARARAGERGLDLSRCGKREREADALALVREERERVAEIRRRAREGA